MHQGPALYGHLGRCVNTNTQIRIIWKQNNQVGYCAVQPQWPLKTGSTGGDSVVSMLQPVLKLAVFHHLPPVAGVGCRFIFSLFDVGVTGPYGAAAVSSQRASSEEPCHLPSFPPSSSVPDASTNTTECVKIASLIIELFNLSSKRKSSLTFSSCYFIYMQYWETDVIYGFNMLEFCFKTLITDTWYLSFWINDWGWKYLTNQTLSKGLTLQRSKKL